MVWISIIFIPIACGLLGAWAGADKTSKSWRREGIPVLLSIFSFIILRNPFCFLLILYDIVFRQGYGIPDKFDNGSSLGSFWLDIVKNHNLADIMTRATIGLMIAIISIVIPVIKGNWLLYTAVTPIMIFNYVLWGAIILNEGMFTLANKRLLWEEFYIYMGIGLYVSVLTLF